MMRTWSSDMSLRVRRSLSLGRTNEAGDAQRSFWIFYVLFLARFVHLITLQSTSKSAVGVDGGPLPWRTGIRASLLLGTEVLLVRKVARLAFLIPPLIISWTTIIVFEFVFGHVLNKVVLAVNKTVDRKNSQAGRSSQSRAKVVKNGFDLAKEMSYVGAVRGAFFALACGAMIYLRGYIRDF